LGEVTEKENFMKKSQINMSESQLADFCKRWNICELALFGSATRADFNEDSDIDILVTFTPEATWGLLDHCRMEQELEDILHRKVDMLTKRSVEQSANWLIRREILNTAEVIYES
jgi:hypothetical protein